MKFKIFFEAAQITDVEINLMKALIPAEYNPAYKKRTGKVAHLRIQSSEPVESILKKYPISIEISDKKLASGKYPTYVCTFNSDYSLHGKIFSEDSFFYLVNTYSIKTKIKKKSLTPDKLGLNEKQIKTFDFFNKINNEIYKLDHFSEEEKQYLIDLVDKSDTDSEEKINIEAPDSLSKEDLNQIAIDFGEICSIKWCVNQINKQIDSEIKNIKFPSGNERLFDSILIDDEGVEYKISNKVGKGGPPSIDAIVHVLETKPELFHSFNEHKINILKQLKHLSVVDGIIKANVLLDTDGINELSNIMDIDINLINPKIIENWCADNKSNLINKLEFFYKKINKNVKKDTFDRLTHGNQKLNGLILSPLAYYVVDLMNKDDEFNEILNAAARQIEIIQVYTKLTNKFVEYTIKNFKEESFKFRYNGNALNPSLKKIAFEME